MYRQRGALQVLVGGGNVRVACLVAGNHDALSVGKVTYARVLQAVELPHHGRVLLPHSLKTESGCA